MAFSELVRRHVDLVYFTAMRLMGDADAAKDVTQAVFLALARKPSELAKHPVLSGWLHCTARNLSAKNVRSEVRRKAREQEAAAMNEVLSGPVESTWAEIEPHLDAALGELNPAERDAVMLRYFERKSASEMAGVLEISSDAAQKRVSRGVERMRDYFARRGVVVGANGLILAVGAHATPAAPAGLVATISGAAFAGGTGLASVSGGIATTAKILAMTTLKRTLVTTIIAVLTGVAVYEARQTAQLRTQLEVFSQRQAVPELPSEQVITANKSNASNSERLRELLRLRGEVALLRRQQRELEQALATRSGLPQSTMQRALDVPSRANARAPFQIQLVTDETAQDAEPMTNNAHGANPETLYVQKTPLLDHTVISTATVGVNPQSGSPEINVEFSDLGKELFATVTRENLNKRFAMVLNGRLYSAPVIRSEIAGGKAQISGDFSESEARELAAAINEAIQNR